METARWVGVLTVLFSTLAIVINIIAVPIMLKRMASLQTQVHDGVAEFKMKSNRAWDTMMTVRSIESARINDNNNENDLIIVKRNTAPAGGDARSGNTLGFVCAPGPQGIPGRPGKDATHGAPGEPGQPGMNADEVPVDEDLHCIQCPPGKQGPEGAEGLRGYLGRKGQTGESGIPGVDGMEGMIGETGFEGLAGITGKPGKKGPPGRDAQGGYGKPGPKGAPGPIGRAGMQGPRGADNFLEGPAGGAGKRGIHGPDGTPGRNGDRGDRGEKGYKGSPGSFCPCPAELERYVARQHEGLNVNRAAAVPQPPPRRTAATRATTAAPRVRTTARPRTTRAPPQTQPSTVPPTTTTRRPPPTRATTRAPAVVNKPEVRSNATRYAFGTPVHDVNAPPPAQPETTEQIARRRFSGIQSFGATFTGFSLDGKPAQQQQHQWRAHVTRKTPPPPPTTTTPTTTRPTTTRRTTTPTTTTATTTMKTTTTTTTTTRRPTTQRTTKPTTRAAPRSTTTHSERDRARADRQRQQEYGNRQRLRAQQQHRYRQAKAQQRLAAQNAGIDPRRRPELGGFIANNIYWRGLPNVIPTRRYRFVTKPTTPIPRRYWPDDGVATPARAPVPQPTIGVASGNDGHIIAVPRAVPASFFQRLGINSGAAAMPPADSSKPPTAESPVHPLHPLAYPSLPNQTPQQQEQQRATPVVGPIENAIGPIPARTPPEIGPKPQIGPQPEPIVDNYDEYNEYDTADYSETIDEQPPTQQGVMIGPAPHPMQAAAGYPPFYPPMPQIPQHQFFAEQLPDQNGAPNNQQPRPMLEPSVTYHVPNPITMPQGAAPIPNLGTQSRTGIFAGGHNPGQELKSA